MNPSFSLNTYLMGLKPKPYSPIHGFHSSGTSAGFGPGSRASGDCPSEEHAERRLRKRATANCLIKRDRNLSSTPGFLSARSEEHTSELQSQSNLVCRLLLEKKKK